MGADRTGTATQTRRGRAPTSLNSVVPSHYSALRLWTVSDSRTEQRRYCFPDSAVLKELLLKGKTGRRTETLMEAEG